jgi:NitT/TauT family transport system substrate-binding protein
MEKWTGVEKEVLYLYFSKGGHLTQDPTIKKAWVDTLKFDHRVLAQEKLASGLDFDSWINESYIKRAYVEMGLDYEAEKAKVVDTLVTNAGRPKEIWHARDGILTYPTMRQFLKAVAEFQATGAKLNASYVYDHPTGLKLFGKTAFYVRKPDGEFVSFLRKGEAEEFAATANGKIFSFEEAVANSGS